MEVKTSNEGCIDFQNVWGHGSYHQEKTQK